MVGREISSRNRPTGEKPRPRLQPCVMAADARRAKTLVGEIIVETRLDDEDTAPPGTVRLGRLLSGNWRSCKAFGDGRI